MKMISLSYSKENETLAFAAEELKRHLQQACKDLSASDSCADSMVIRLDIADPVSADDAFQIDIADPVSADDAFQIDITPAGGTITGSNARSVLLGVYHYLRTLGFVFLTPRHTKIPPDLVPEHLACSCEKKASLRHRGVCIEGADSIENILDYIDWLPKLGYNAFFLQFHKPFTFLDRYYDEHAHTLESGEKSSLYELFFQKMLREIRKRSLLLHTVGHGWTCAALSLPSVGWVKEYNEPTAAMRTLLAEVGGKRAYTDGVPLNTNLCYANPDAICAFVNAVTDYAKANPQADYIHVWLADEPNHICECGACTKEFFTDQYVRLLNRIDAELSAKGLSCKLVFLLYQELLYPPVYERILNPNRFVLMFAPISRTFKESYPQKILPVPLREFRRNHMQLPVSIEENLSYLHGWQQCFSGDSLDYDYPLGRAHYGDFGYVHIAHTIFHDIESLPALSLNGYISCQELRISSPNALPCFVMGYKLFDMNEDFDVLCKEYFEAAYGSSAPQIFEYLSVLSDLSDCDYFNGIGPRKNPAAAASFQKAVEEILRFRPLLESLIEASKESPLPVVCRSTSDTTANTPCPSAPTPLRILLFHSHYTQLLAAALGALASDDAPAARDAYLQFKKYIRENEEEFEPYLDVWRILEVSEKYTGFQNVLW